MELTVNMELTVKELNEIYYCLYKTLKSYNPTMVDRELAEQLMNRIGYKLKEEYDKTQNNGEIFVAQ